jgi:hypothetical protein
VPSGHITFVAGILGLSFCEIRRPGFSLALIECNNISRRRVCQWKFRLGSSGFRVQRCRVQRFGAPPLGSDPTSKVQRFRGLELHSARLSLQTLDLWLGLHGSTSRSLSAMVWKNFCRLLDRFEMVLTVVFAIPQPIHWVASRTFDRWFYW